MSKLFDLTGRVARINARIPLGRWGTPRDVAGAYVTGQEICVDGGIGTAL